MRGGDPRQAYRSRTHLGTELRQTRRAQVRSRQRAPENPAVGGSRLRTDPKPGEPAISAGERISSPLLSPRGLFMLTGSRPEPSIDAHHSFWERQVLGTRASRPHRTAVVLPPICGRDSRVPRTSVSGATLIRPNRIHPREPIPPRETTLAFPSPYQEPANGAWGAAGPGPAGDANRGRRGTAPSSDRRRTVPRCGRAKSGNGRRERAAPSGPARPAPLPPAPSSPAPPRDQVSRKLRGRPGRGQSAATSRPSQERVT